MRAPATLLAAAALMAGCENAPPAPERPAGLVSYTERIPGTAVEIEMVALPPGERPAFWISRTEIPWDAYDVWAFRLDLDPGQVAAGVDAASRPSKPYGAPDRGFGHAGYPALGVTLLAAQEYCRWLSDRTGRSYRLPTVEEWTYACRAGGADPESPEPALLSGRAWFWDNADDRTHPVGTLEPNAWGLCDMLGNVAEWCTVPGGTALVCGGSFDSRAQKVGCSARQRPSPAWQVTDPQDPKSRWWLSDAPFVGFRIVRVE